MYLDNSDILVISIQNKERIQNTERTTSKPRLPDKTQAFVQHAFAYNADKKLDERKRWLLARYVVADELTFESLRTYAGVKTTVRVWQLYTSALNNLWETSPEELQQKFPKEDILKGKRTGPINRRISEEEKKRREIEYQRRYWQEHKEEKRAHAKHYYQKNKEKIKNKHKEYQRRYRLKCKEQPTPGEQLEQNQGTHIFPPLSTK